MNKLFSKFSNRTKISHKIKSIDPHKNWIFLLRIFFVSITILIIFSLYLLAGVKNDSLFKVKGESLNPPSVLNENLLNKINKMFKQREMTSDLIKSNNSSYSDPSN